MDETAPSPTTLLLPRQAERWQSLVDILYLSQVTMIYIFSAAYPFVGIFYGVLFLAGGLSPKTKRVGRICLILGIINTGLAIISLAAILVLGLAGALAGLSDR
jgi:hypothetical protein